MASSVFTFGNGSTSQNLISGFEGQSVRIAVKSTSGSTKIPFDCYDAPDWVTVVCSENEASVTVSPNTGVTTSAIRQSTFHLTQDVTDKEISIRVTQIAKQYYQFGFEHDGSVTQAYAYQSKASGGTFYVDIKSIKNQMNGSSWISTVNDWNVDNTTKPSWITFTKVYDEIDPTDVIGVNATVAKNTTSVSRSAAVQFVQAESNLSGYMLINQDTPSNVYEFSFPGGGKSYSYTAPSGESTVTIEVISKLNGDDYPFTANISVDYITAVTTSCTAVTLSFATNRTSYSRSTAFTLEQNNSRETLYVFVTQNAGIGTDCQFTIMGKTTYKMDNISPYGTALVAPITSVCSGVNMRFYVNSTIPNWITGVSIASDFTSISGMVKPNNSAVDNKERSAQIRLVQTWGEPDKYINITLVQRAGVNYDYGIYSGYTTIRTASKSLSRTASSFQLEMTSLKHTPSGTGYTDSFVAYTVTSTVGWITFSTAGYSELGHITVNVSDNGGAQRSGSLKLTQSDTNYVATLNITQEGDNTFIGNVPLTIVPEYNDFDEQYGDVHVSVDVPIGETISASTDGGSTWMEICRKCIIDSSDSFGIKLLGSFKNSVPHIDTDGRFTVSGSVFSLIYGENFTGQTQIPSGCTLQGLFSGCTGLIDASDMFLGSGNTAMQPFCYARMFAGCSSLKTGPTMDYSSLAYGCFEGMFYDCVSLTSAHVVSVGSSTKALAERCFYDMFHGCKRIGSTSGIQYIRLSASTLVEDCYNSMFVGCENMSEIICAASDISADRCTQNWVKGVSKTGEFKKLSTMNDWPRGVNGIPDDWTVS